MTANLPAASWSRLHTAAVALVAATLLLGALAYPVAPGRFVVHWSAGFEDAYTGIEALPKPVGLFAVPAVSVATYGLLRALPALAGPDQFAGVRHLYDALVVVVLAVLLVSQAGLLWLNLA